MSELLAPPRLLREKKFSFIKVPEPVSGAVPVAVMMMCPVWEVSVDTDNPLLNVPVVLNPPNPTKPGVSTKLI